MKRRFAGGLALLCNVAVMASGAPPPTAQQIIERHAAARGGADAWAAVQSMGWAGNIVSSEAKAEVMPFLMFFQRPNSARFELIRQTQHAVRGYDGTRGWKLRPGGERGLEVLDYTTEELAAARDACGLDGPLIDPASKGVQVTLEGGEDVDGRNTWRLKVVLPSGAVQHHWIDADSYLDLRYDRVARDPTGRKGTVMVHLRNYQKVGNLQVPMQIESQPASGGASDRMVIEKVTLDPTLAAGTFEPPSSRPLDLPRHGGVIVNASGQ